MRIERSKVRRFAQKYEKDEKLSVINRQGIYKNDYKEAPSAFYKAMLNSKRTVDRVKLEGVDSSNGNHLHKTLNEPASVEASPICPISNEHLGRESIVRSGGSSRDIFASPSPKSCNVGRCKDAMNIDKVSRSDDIVNDPSTVHRIGACRNLSETLQSQQSELTTAVSRRSSATSEEDSIDSSVWDAIDFNAIDAAVIGTSHRQQQSNGKAVMNQRGGLMSAERTTEERLMTSTERDISEKRTARVGHKLDGFSDFNFESDEDEDVRIDTIASSNLERREKGTEAANAYKVSVEEATCRSETHRSDGGNDRRMGNSISLSKQMEQSDVVTAVLERQHGELKSRISKEFSAFTFESDEEEEVEEKMPATRSINSEVSTITSSTRASNTAKESTIGNFSIFNFESDESEEGCRMRTATPSIDMYLLVFLLFLSLFATII
uniref:Uncharacterized protein n=2 Tax=Parascaris univalens TaxID=6257 RepID=A0A915BTQ6_PARUN